jgi:hypothetical protein
VKLPRIRFHEDKPSVSGVLQDGQTVRIAKLIDDFFCNTICKCVEDVRGNRTSSMSNCLVWKKDESDIWFGKVSYTDDVKSIFDGWKCNTRKLLNSSTIHLINHGEVLVSC